MRPRLICAAGSSCAARSLPVSSSLAWGRPCRRPRRTPGLALPVAPPVPEEGEEEYVRTVGSVDGVWYSRPAHAEGDGGVAYHAYSFHAFAGDGGFPTPVSAAGPHVAATTPASGDGGVEPGLTEIRVTLSQPMDPSSYSFVALGSGFPHVTGQPYWVDDFTVALPVHLEPDQAYWLLLNSSNAQGFRNRSGAPAVPHLLGFWTAGGSGR